MIAINALSYKLSFYIQTFSEWVRRLILTYIGAATIVLKVLRLTDLQLKSLTVEKSYFPGSILTARPQTGPL